ncbi:DHHW family protein, partial [Zwartia sp.]
PEAKQSSPVEATQAKPLNVVGGVLLHEGQALFMFQGTDRGAQGYANAVNTWVELVAKKRPGMTSTVVVTPTSSHFYLPPAARAKTTSEPKNLAAMRAALLPEVRFADVVTEMEGHQDEALFFKSDHHWTGLGAYYAYRAWARANGVTPLELSAFSKRSVPGVAGSFWSLTQAPELRNADKESYYYVPTTVTFDGTQYAGPQQKTPMPQPFFAEKSRGYIVFLGGDIPLLVSNTSAGTGRTALVVKNSYGNAFAPYLLPHFDRVVVLDYRYVSRNIQDIVDTFGVTDLVFVNATITANSGAHQERMRQVARGSSTAWLTEAEKRRLKQQEDAAGKTQASAAVSDKAQ